jgi:hypothetical protein
MAKKVKVEEFRPFAITILGREWIVEVVEGPIDVDGMLVSGFADADACKIVIIKHPNRTFMRHILAHEIFHAAAAPVTNNGLRGFEGWIPEEQAAELSGMVWAEILEQAHMLPSWVLNRGKV